MENDLDASAKIDNIRIDTVKNLHNEGLTRINKNDHYEVTSFGRNTVYLNNDLAAAEVIFNSVGSREKHLWHVLNGKRLLEKKVHK